MQAVWAAMPVQPIPPRPDAGVTLKYALEKARSSSGGRDADGDVHLLAAAAEDDAAQRHHVGEVGAPGQRDVARVGPLVVGRVELHPAELRRIGSDPGVRSI